MNYERNLKYFQTVDLKGALIAMTIGAILTLIGFSGSGESLIIGLLLLVGGFFYLKSTLKGIVSDKEYDQSVLSALKDINQKALNKLGLDESEANEISPISFDGYVIKGYDYAKKGEDGKWRTNKYQSTTLFFSANEVHCYTYSYSTTEEKKTESTDVYFYKDIVSVSTASDTIKYPEETKETEYEYFKLTTTGGTALSVTLRDKDGAQESINNMRKLLKQKKTI